MNLISKYGICYRFAIALKSNCRVRRQLLTLGSGLIDHSQKMTVAAMTMADMKVWAHRS
jgi:hypothetical protein